MKRIFLLCCILFVLTNLSFAQWGLYTLYVLGISPSPLLSSYGSAGTSAPISDAYNFYYNPAQLGLNPEHNNLSIGLYPERTYLYNLDGLEFSSSVINTGWKFDKSLLGFPFRLGIGYMSARLDVDYRRIGDLEGFSFNSDRYDAFSAGIGLDYYLSFNVGITYKHISSRLPDVPDGFLLVPQDIKTKETLDAADYGVLIIAPLMKLLKDPFKYEYAPGLSVSPFLDLSLGYAKRNSGGEISFYPGQRRDPILRTASLGYTVSAGTCYDLQPDNTIKLFEVDFSTEAEDLLVKFNYEAQTSDEIVSYQGFLGDINPWKNVVLAQWDKNVLRHRGIRLELAEVLQLNWGSIRLYNNYYETKGWGLRAKGFLKALRPAGKAIAFIADHFDLQYFYTAKNSAPYTDMSSFSFVVSGLENLF